MSLSYDKSGANADDQKLRFEVLEGSFVKATSPISDPLLYFTADGRLNVNAVDPNGALNSSGEANASLSGMAYFAAEVNPSTYAGKLSAWVNPGGGYGEAVRGFVFSTALNDSGSISGCAYAGAIRDVSIRKALKEDTSLLKPSGCFTPQMTQGVCGPNDNIGNQIWKQCFVQDAEGIYGIDPANVLDMTAGFDVLQAAPAGLPTVDTTSIAGVRVN